jgi:hypothetical protein
MVHQERAPDLAPELDYANLGEVSDGGGVQTAYLEILASQTRPERRAHVIDALTIYCQRDTLAMVRLAQYFANGIDVVAPE